jgi:hypothetical protein
MKLILATAAALCLTLAVHAQEGFGKLDPTLPSGITVDQIIQKMGARESEFAAARLQYTFRQEVKFNTISDDTNKPDGEYREVTDITFDKDGRRQEHVVFAPANTIERVTMTENDFKDIEKRLPFILTAPELPDYNFKYAGRQKIDEIDTYAFDVEPKRYEKGKRYFQGRVWVDQQDDEIVMVNGLNVPQDTRPGHADLSPPFTTYYEQIDGKYWFPTYTRAEGTLHFPPQNGAMAEDITVRSIIKYTDYKQFHTNVRIIYNGEDITNQKDDSQQKPSQPTPPPSPPKNKPQQ